METLNGRPRSCANNHMIRDAVAMKPMVHENTSAMTMEVIPIALLRDWVADKKTSIKGKLMVV